jgi:hypothetical protein
MTTSRKPSLETNKDAEVVATTEQLEATSLDDSSKPVVAPTEEPVGEVIVHGSDEKEEEEEARTAAAPEATDAAPEATATDVTPEAAKEEETAVVTVTPVEETETPAVTVTSHSLFSTRVPSPVPAPAAELQEAPRP